ncbi:glycosyltransferase family 4 protein [Dictyobacter formicarum]|uniref:LPS biosynthesis protein n=1 Tax=Dictyobacter formicarum TaxID=2778368 RepID=A0ABQ3VDE3_9CHLR|nr:glycosyltransferase family 4 protein [Dictyobacter formicarum]GHO83176.1 LPS biosynthesis protein [Dictyobacter formicarum]
MAQAKKLRVLMVTAVYFPFMGGIQTHVHEVGRRLAQNGVDVTLLTTVAQQPASPLPREEEVEGMRVIRIPSWPSQTDYYIAPEIASIIKQGNWDLVHCQGCHSFVPLFAMYAARVARIPYIMTFHTGGHSSSWRNSIRSVQWQIQRPLLMRATKLIGVSRFEATYFRTLLRLPQEQFTVIPNGAVVPEVVSRATPESGTLLITSIGRLEKYKGHQHMISAMPRILEKRPEAKLLILGVGPYQAVLEAKAREIGVAERVEIRSVPAHDRQAMADILSRSALVTLLSEYEAHPIAVMEALALQRPVLVADTSGLREIAEQGFARAVPLKSSSEEIAQAALQQIEDPLLPPRQFALSTWDDCAQKLLEIYASAVERKLCVF